MPEGIPCIKAPTEIFLPEHKLSVLLEEGCCGEAGKEKYFDGEFCVSAQATTLDVSWGRLHTCAAINSNDIYCPLKLR